MESKRCISQAPKSISINQQPTLLWNYNDNRALVRMPIFLSDYHQVTRFCSGEREEDNTEIPYEYIYARTRMNSHKETTHDK